MAVDDKSITSELDELHRQARSARRTLEPEWLMNLAMFQGKQWLSFGSSGLYEPVLDSSRITVTEDRIAGAVRTELAKMTKSRPIFVVTPNTGDEEDANAAQLAERLMRFQWKHLKMHELSLKALEWSRICGAGFLKCYWDSTIGDEQEVLLGPDGEVMSDPQSGRPMRGDQQAAAQFSQHLGVQVTSKKIAQGDVRVEVRSPFQMFVDPLCDTFPEAEWVIEESVKSAEYVWRRYGVDLKPDTNANPGLVEARLISGLGASSYKGIKIREYWCKPSKKHPQGCRIPWAQGKILESDEKPFDPMPYVMLTGIPVPGRLWPMSIVDLLRGPQIELNKTLSQMAENRNRISNPTGLASKQAIPDQEKFLEEIAMPGHWHFYDEMSQHVPQYLEPPTLPDYVKEMPARTVSAMEDLSGQHEVTNAQVPPGVTAASAITLLQEADDTRLGLAMQDYEEQMARFGNKVLALVANYYTDARTIKIGGEDGAWEIFDFKGAMLRGNTTLEVEGGSSLPQSKAGQQASLTDWMNVAIQSGNPPHGRQLAQFLRDQGLGSQARLLTEWTTSETQVNRENALMSLGQDLPINSYDDDDIHVEGHQDFQRQPRYAQFSPQIQQIIEKHTNAHQQRQQQQQQEQLQQQLQLTGQIPPNESAAALQDAQQLSQLQGQQAQQQGQAQGQALQQQLQAAQAVHQMGGQQQSQQADLAQQMQQAQHADELHTQRLSHQQQMHEARLEQIRQKGASGGR